MYEKMYKKINFLLKYLFYLILNRFNILYFRLDENHITAPFDVADFEVVVFEIFHFYLHQYQIVFVVMVYMGIVAAFGYVDTNLVVVGNVAFAVLVFAFEFAVVVVVDIVVVVVALKQQGIRYLLAAVMNHVNFQIQLEAKKIFFLLNL